MNRSNRFGWGQWGWSAAVCIMAGALLAGCAKSGGMGAADLRCEYRANPLGIDAQQPRFSWIMRADEDARAARQTAYQVLVAGSAETLARNEGDLWDSGRVESSGSIQIAYDGKPLKSAQECFWKVKMWDRNGMDLGWSEPARFSVGLLNASDWKGQWIGKDEPKAQTRTPGPLDQAKWIWFPGGKPEASAPVGTVYFRKEFNAADKPARARCLVAADNQFTLFVNGKKAGTGGDFSHAAEFDITELLTAGKNVIAVAATNVGEAANPAGVIAAVVLDGNVTTTDAQWKSSNKEAAGWESAEFDDSAWAAAQELGTLGIKPWGDIAATDRTRLAARYLRKEFPVGRNIRSATLWMCGLGLSEVYLNGNKVSDDVLSPGLTEYPKRSLYVTYDVKDSLKEGMNAVGVILGNGRFLAPRFKVPITTQTYGYPKLMFQLDIVYEDNSVMRVVSDESWKLTTDGPILANNEYDGEEFDARKEMPGWDRAGFDDSKWEKPQVVQAPGEALSAQMMEPIRITQQIKPVAITKPRPGVHIFDMGQNMVGWCRINVNGKAGTEVRLRHAETLRPDGELYLDNIRSALVTDIYTLKGQGTEVWEPRFTYHGFRYVEVTGWPGEPSLSSIEGQVVHDDMRKSGEFSCSNELINRIYSNIVWGVRGNYRSFPTDCPQRDERQAWLGDRSSESRGETFLHDVSSLYAKWIRDIHDAQRPNGSVSDVCPSYWPLYNDGVTWPSSFIIIPAALYEQYGEKRVLEQHYPGMRKWIEHMKSYMKDDLMPRDTYGDWCVPPESQELIHSKDPMRKTNGTLIGTAYFIYDLRLMSQYANLLGKASEASEYDILAQRMTAAFNRQFFKQDVGYYDNGSQTSCVLPLAFGLVPEGQRKRVFDHLVKKIEGETNSHIGTGLIGGQWLMRILSDYGRPDLAYTLASQETYPSWGYMVSKGATTIWELWNGDTADPAMNSGNHVMLVGDLGIWFYEYLAGIQVDPKGPGFKRITMKPHVVGNLSHVNASYRSMYGPIRSQWKRDGQKLEWTLSVPPNTMATVYVPASDAQGVTESGKPAEQSPGVQFMKMQPGAAVYEVGSGTYVFRSTLNVEQ